MNCRRALIAAALAAVVPGAALAAETPKEAPKATPGWGPQKACVSEQDVFNNDGGPHFSLQLTNKCEERLTCRAWAYVITARGPTKAHAVLRLGPKSAGAEATKAYVFKVKVAGGTAEVAHRCKPD